ncbi:pentapeptide repeat-containing protein [Stackebrandtia nassauensis]|uniref:Pentapeptide repeat protein n=1 Tax=Stackebrandtia nassauensis (strain DSM 44728 / CIP 108903 / NRRL B-16338 / NBRC 102104 / LLR-40K-21) TaxID=446470 RepID=D3PTZ3_STANL|nr:pentapeptide repeat-containing protein [Stackebrandtia nassauensis]ADD39751.1 hypothetical protein Snas_0029 [Stackebrandtia nassauensis DSM 44728]
MNELKPRAFWWAAAVGVLLTTVVATTLSTIALASGNTETAQLWIDIVTRSLTVTAGLGGAFALWLAFRRQRHTERDAVNRRTTELRIQAIEQLGSDKPIVRIGGLHNLEALAQGNSGLQEIVLEEICTYLRMPFYEPHDTENYDIKELWGVTQEREARRTAQHILERHLKPDGPYEYWDHDQLNLRQAALNDLNLRGCRLNNADFAAAELGGITDFRDAAFRGDTTSFTMTEFDAAWFDNALFTAVARFHDTIFTQPPNFTGAAATRDDSVEHVWPNGWHLDPNSDSTGFHQITKDELAE